MCGIEVLVGLATEPYSPSPPSVRTGVSPVGPTNWTTAPGWGTALFQPPCRSKS
ncbi:hypothetical protein T484DRAFT_1990024 [Baffinella frigidus]|nr:hypothetical protein T484DRAFT_1990024 [Cryptophyta sp. CCMP2293]